MVFLKSSDFDLSDPTSENMSYIADKDDQVLTQPKMASDQIRCKCSLVCVLRHQ